MSKSHAKGQELLGKLKSKYRLKGFDLPAVEIDGVASGGTLSLSSLPSSGLKITIPAGGASGPAGQGILLLAGLDSEYEIERAIDKQVEQNIVVSISSAELSNVVAEEVYAVYTVEDEGSVPFFMFVVN